MNELNEGVGFEDINSERYQPCPLSGSRIERAFVSSEFGTTRTPRIKLACKVKPLDLITKHLGLG
jgi:hypothetical protein